MQSLIFTDIHAKTSDIHVLYYDDVIIQDTTQTTNRMNLNLVVNYYNVTTSNY